MENGISEARSVIQYNFTCYCPDTGIDITAWTELKPDADIEPQIAEARLKALESFWQRGLCVSPAEVKESCWRYNIPRQEEAKHRGLT
ncbi:MAG: hypothetical protein KGZ41_03395 [Dethiobacter sp.]|jgi:hypothetical protein|nr:hypothetical protein [Dethiobacter sp.]